MTQPEPYRAEARRRMLAAARDLISSNGIRAVTMADVARRADYTRQMVYKVFFGRRELIRAAVVQRIEEIADAAAAGTGHATDADSASSFPASFVQISVDVIESVRSDPELGALLGVGSPVALFEALWAPELIERALRFWQPWLERGRAERVLRDDLCDDDLADWLHTVYASIILRQNIPPDDERSLIERFVLTSLAMATSKKE